MADAQSNSGGPTVDPPGMAKKKKAKAPRKPRSECTPKEIAKLDAESTKRRNQRSVVKDNFAAAKFAAERDAMEAARHKAEVEDKEALVNKAHALLMLGICRPSDFSAAAVGPASTGSSVARPPHYQSRTTPMSPGFPPPRHDGQTCFSGSPDMSLLAPSTPCPSAVIDLNITPGSSSGGRPSVEMQRKQAHPPFTGTMPSPRVLFDGMPTPTPPVDDPYYNQFMEDVIYDSGHVRTYDPEETQSQDGRAQFVADEEADDRADYDHGDSWHEDDDIYVKVMVMKMKAMTLAFQSLEAFKARHNDKPTTLTHCWTIINNCPKFKDRYRELQRKRGKKTAKFTRGGDDEALRGRGARPTPKVDDIRDASSMALHETLHGMMSQKDARDEKKRQSKDEQMKQYLELQRKKLEMEEAAKKRKIDMEEAARQRQLDIEAANVKARQRQLDIKATNAATKVKEVALAIMSMDLTKMSEKTKSWFEARQKEMFDADGLH
ncbi:hypothetical protein VPH35_054510 [Triticum aestivum]